TSAPAAARPAGRLDPKTLPKWLSIFSEYRNEPLSAAWTCDPPSRRKMGEYFLSATDMDSWHRGCMPVVEGRGGVTKWYGSTKFWTLRSPDEMRRIWKQVFAERSSVRRRPLSRSSTSTRRILLV